MFTPVLNDRCDVCGWIYYFQLLNLVSLKDGVFFVCSDCCKKILSVDGWRGMKLDELKDVLDL